MHITFSSSSASARPPLPPAPPREGATSRRQRVSDKRRVHHRSKSRRRAEYAAPARGLREHSSRRRRHATRQHMPHGTDETSREGTRDDLLDGVISETHPARGDDGGEWCRRERASDGDGVKSRTGVCASTAEEASEREGGGEPGELGVAGRHAVGVAKSTARKAGPGLLEDALEGLRDHLVDEDAREGEEVPELTAGEKRAEGGHDYGDWHEGGEGHGRAHKVVLGVPVGERGKSPVIRAIWCDRRARRAAGATQEWVGPHLTYVRLKGFIRVVVGAMVEGRRRQKWAVVARRPGYIFCLDDRWKKPTTVRERRFRDLRDGPSEVVTPAASPATRACERRARTAASRPQRDTSRASPRHRRDRIFLERAYRRPRGSPETLVSHAIGAASLSDFVEPRA